MHKNEKQHWVQTSTGKVDCYLTATLKQGERCGIGIQLQNKGKGEGDDVPGDNKHDKGKGKWKLCGHFVVSLVPDILSGETHSLHVLVRHSGHTSSQPGREDE